MILPVIPENDGISPLTFAPMLVTTLAATIALSVITLPLIPEKLHKSPDVDAPILETILSTVLVLVAPEMFPTLVMLFVPIAITPVIVPPVKGRNGPPVIEAVVIPVSLITLSDVNATTLFNTPVDGFDKTLFVKCVLTVPTNEPFKYTSLNGINDVPISQTKPDAHIFLYELFSSNSEFV